MSDLSIAVERAIESPAGQPPAAESARIELRSAFLRVVDAEGKMAAALEALGPIAGRDVVILDSGRGFRARQLCERGGRVVAVVAPSLGAEAGAAFDGEPSPDVRFSVGTPEATGLADESADVVVSFWSAFHGPDSRHLAEAERVLRPAGRLLVVHDYGRDDVCALWRDDFAQQIEWSRRNGPFLGGGFRVRVVHCRWTFESLEEAATLLGAAFGDAGAALASSMKRPRLEYNVAVYHRTREVEDLASSPAASVAS